ncbi:MAG TPA: (deoxy)nucleoside triphosphate pyrophosphohydrolase [Candidatus Acidoferrales bacterium]|nr:(deoxy)nucleoside triphosphate pyrophosphohydrolase [Candidatus Acidoferrales bacterium]
MIRVVAAVIERDGRILICQRRRTGRFPLKWEFPGGKIEGGESPQAALARELFEELGAKAEVGRELYRTEHRYRPADPPFALMFFAAQLEGTAVKSASFEQIAWALPRELPAYDFLEANLELIAKLASCEITPR